MPTMAAAAVMTSQTGDRHPDVRIPRQTPNVTIAKAATTAGAQIRTDSEIKSVVVKNGKATGVVLANGEEIAASRDST